MRTNSIARLMLLVSAVCLQVVHAQQEPDDGMAAPGVETDAVDYVEWIVESSERDPNVLDPIEVPFAPDHSGEQPSPWDRLIETIDRIRFDPTAAALASLDWWCDPFDALDDPPEGLEEQAATLTGNLESYVRHGSNDWLVDRVALALARCSETRWSSLFLDLLDHPSSQLRWRAIQHFGEVAHPASVPILETLWKERLPTWMRTDVVIALLENGSTVHARDCFELVDSDDLELARVAVRTLAEIRPYGAAAYLRRLASRSDSPVREEAISALANWPDDDESMRVLLDLISRESGPVKSAALSALSNYAQREAVDRLIEIAADASADSSFRKRALRAVVNGDHPNLIGVLSGILDEPSTDETVTLQALAREGLSRLGVEIPAPAPNESETQVSIMISCGGFYWSNEIEGRVLPEPGEDSIRCWAAPNIAGDPEEYERLEAGMPVEVSDHFRSGEEHWVEVHGEGCWISALQVDPSAEPWEENLDWPFRQEFDVWRVEVDSPMGKELLAEDMVRVFDVDETVAGIRFEIDPNERDVVRRLAEIFVDDESSLSWYVWDAMDALAELYAEDPSLGQALDRALAE